MSPLITDLTAYPMVMLTLPLLTAVHWGNQPKGDAGCQPPPATLPAWSSRHLHGSRGPTQKGAKEDTSAPNALRI